MISKRIQFLKDENLRGELLVVINEWQDWCDCHVTEADRLDLVFALEAYLKGTLSK